MFLKNLNSTNFRNKFWISTNFAQAAGGKTYELLPEDDIAPPDKPVPNVKQSHDTTEKLNKKKEKKEAKREKKEAKKRKKAAKKLKKKLKKEAKKAKKQRKKKTKHSSSDVRT